MRRASFLLAGILALPSCTALEPHAPPPAVTSPSDLDTLNAKIDALAGKLSATVTSAASGNIPAAASQGAETVTGITALAREYGVSISDVLIAVVLSLGGVRFWRGSIKSRKGIGPTVTFSGSK